MSPTKFIIVMIVVVLVVGGLGIALEQGSVPLPNSAAPAAFASLGALVVLTMASIGIAVVAFFPVMTILIYARLGEIRDLLKRNAP